MQATQIVDKLLKEAIDPEEMVRELANVWAEDRFKNQIRDTENINFQFGFVISTGHPDNIEINLRENGVTPESLGGWEQISAELGIIEHNLIKLLTNAGLTLRSEGHDNNGDLVGTAWFDTKHNAHNYGRPNWKGFEFVTTQLDKDEPLTTSSGSIMSIEDADKFLFTGVQDAVASAADVSFAIFDCARLEAFIEGFEEGISLEDTMARVNAIAEAKKQMPDLPEHPFLTMPQAGIFRKLVNGVEIFSARCPGCKRIHGNFRTYDEAAGNRQCQFCTRDYVDKMTKVATTGNFKHMLKKDHEARASR